MSIHVTVLGSGTIIPTRDRYATSILLEMGGERVLLDCAPCAPHAMEKSGIPFYSVDRIFLTHFHPDHTLGLGHLLAALNQMPLGVSWRVELYGPRGLRSFLDRLYSLYPATVPKRSGLRIVEVDQAIMDTDAPYAVGSVRTRHGDMAALAYRFEFEGASVVYTGDTEIFDELIEFAKDCDLLISECSFPDALSVEGHMTPGDVAEAASRAAAKELLLVHFYPEMYGIDVESIIGRRFEGRIHVGYDSFRITI